MEQSDADQQMPGVSLREAARQLGCSVDTVQRRLKNGRLRGEISEAQRQSSMLMMREERREQLALAPPQDDSEQEPEPGWWVRLGRLLWLCP